MTDPFTSMQVRKSVHFATRLLAAYEDITMTDLMGRALVEYAENHGIQLPQPVTTS